MRAHFPFRKGRFLLGYLKLAITAHGSIGISELEGKTQSNPRKSRADTGKILSGKELIKGTMLKYSARHIRGRH